MSERDPVCDSGHLSPDRPPPTPQPHPIKCWHVSTLRTSSRSRFKYSSLQRPMSRDLTIQISWQRPTHANEKKVWNKKRITLSHLYILFRGNGAAFLTSCFSQRLSISYKCKMVRIVLGTYPKPKFCFQPHSSGCSNHCHSGTMATGLSSTRRSRRNSRRWWRCNMWPRGPG